MTSELIARIERNLDQWPDTICELDPADVRALITLASRASVGEDAVEAYVISCRESRSTVELSPEALAALTQAIEGQATA